MVIIIIYRCWCEEKYLMHAHHHHAVYMPCLHALFTWPVYMPCLRALFTCPVYMACLRALFTWPVYMPRFATRGSINTTLMPHDNVL